MTRRCARITTTLVFGVAVAGTPAAQAAGRVRYHGNLFYDLFELDEVRAKFRRESGLDPRIRISVGQADIDMDGVPEVFATGREDDCEKWGCYTGAYKKVDGNWVEVEGLSAFFGNDDDPLIYIREEVVDGMRTLYSSRHEPMADPGPDQKVIFGTAEEIFSDEERINLPQRLVGDPAKYWFGRFDMDDAG